MDEMVQASSMHGKIRNAHKILIEEPEEKDNSGQLGVGRRIILKWISLKKFQRSILNLSGPEQSPMVGSCEHGNEILDSIKRKKILV
jgi:hypothetical protein